MADVLLCLKKYGERRDSEISAETGISVVTVRQTLADLAATGAVIGCSVSRFENGKRIDEWMYRVSGYIPPAAPGRKAKTA